MLSSRYQQCSTFLVKFLGYNETFCGPSPTYCNQTEWPCKAHQGQTFPASISGWKLFGTNESELQAQLIANGPLSVLMDASGFPPLEYHEYGRAVVFPNKNRSL